MPIYKKNEIGARSVRLESVKSADFTCNGANLARWQPAVGAPIGAAASTIGAPLVSR